MESACFMSQKVHTNHGAHPGFYSVKQLEIFLLHPEWDASPLPGQHYYVTSYRSSSGQPH